jgi:hypothetical protein
MALDTRRMVRGALAGGIAAGVWAFQQPLDKRALRCDYDDVELLGRAVLPRADRARWYPAGLLLHVQNGAMFGAVYAGVLGPVLARGGVPRGLGAPLVALVENFGLWPLGRLSDRFHPARDELPGLTGNRRALTQATWRHLLFGIVLGELERRLNQEPAEPPLPAA